MEEFKEMHDVICMIKYDNKCMTSTKTKNEFGVLTCEKYKDVCKWLCNSDLDLIIDEIDKMVFKPRAKDDYADESLSIKILIRNSTACEITKANVESKNDLLNIISWESTPDVEDEVIRGTARERI